nr:hypothetical protein [uncultured Clostridium sp.]
MWKSDSGSDPNARNPTPMKKSYESALRADVSGAGEVFDPGSLTCIIFDRIVHPCFIAGNVRKYSLTRFLISCNVCDLEPYKKTAIDATFY